MTPGHVVLVGLPGAGKSTVGPLVAERLGRGFVDLDAELERRAGRSVAAQFARDGEPAFRAGEAGLSAELAAAEPAVLAPGGGWAANAAARAALAGRGVVVYLRVTPEAAYQRVMHGLLLRPLLAQAGDALATLRALQEGRAAAYASADVTVDADGAPEAVAERVVAALRAREGAGG